MACIEARGLRKAFGNTVALDGLNLRIEEGRILGLIGPNGAGKTTALNAILGLTPYQGELRVLGRDPWAERDQLMRDVCFIADVAVLPRWLRVAQALERHFRSDCDRGRDEAQRQHREHGDGSGEKAIQVLVGDGLNIVALFRRGRWKLTRV